MINRNENCLAIRTFYDAASARTQKLLLNGVIHVLDGYAVASPVSIGLGGETVDGNEL